MICIKCGKEILEGKQFCGYCGSVAATPAVEKACPKCGSIVKEGIKFCGKCGEDASSGVSAVLKPAEQEKIHSGNSANENHNISNPKKKRTKLYVLIAILIVLLAGVLGAFYVFKNGGMGGMFSKNSPTASNDEDKNDSGTEDEQTDDDIVEKEQADTENDDNSDNNKDASQTNKPLTQAEKESIAVGDWVGSFEDNYKLTVRLLSNNTAIVLFELYGLYNVESVVIPLCSIYTIEDGLLNIDGELFGKFDFLQETLEIENDGQFVVIHKTYLTDSVLPGLWESSHTYETIEFTSDRRCYFTSFVSEYPMSDGYDYSYSSSQKALVLTPDNPYLPTERYQVEIVGDYIILSPLDDPDDISVFKKQSGSTVVGGGGAVAASPPVQNNDYILPNSSTSYLTSFDLNSFTVDELRVARNEIYARHGRLFTDEELQRYFDGKSWYNGHTAPEDFSEDMLSQLEKDNIKLMQQMEARLQ